MIMNKAYFPKASENLASKWRLIDAEGQTVGRVASKIAMAIRGKDLANYTPHSDTGCSVVVINADKVVFTGNKWEDKMYVRHSGYVGGRKETSAKDMLKSFPTRIIEYAVFGMLPKRNLGKSLRKKIRIYAAGEHPHQGQVS